MKIVIHKAPFAITDAIRQYSNKKFAKVQKLLPETDSIDLAIAIERHDFHIHAHFQHDGHVFHAHAHDEDLYAAIDFASDKLLAQFKKLKESRTPHLHADSHFPTAKNDLQ